MPIRFSHPSRTSSPMAAPTSHYHSTENVPVVHARASQELHPQREGKKSEIFVQCLPNYGYASPDPSKAPLLFLAICKAWREVALSTPALWTCVRTEIDAIDAHPGLRIPENVAELIRRWFSRARSLPLSFKSSGERGSPHLESGLKTILRRHAPHLCDLQLEIHTLTALTLGTGTDFPLLRKLGLERLDRSIPDGQSIKTFAVAPQLRTLSLEKVPPSVVSIPWEQLTAVELYNVSVEECLTVLRNAPCLHDFWYYYGEGGGNSMSHVVHSSLVYLKLADTGRIIPFLELPMLEQLFMSEITVTGLADTVIPLPLISSKSLQSFTFGQATPTVSLQWIRHMQHLTTLELCTSGWNDMDKLFRALNRAREPHFLANLQNFALLEWDSEELEDELLDSLTSRCTPAHGGLAMLESFEIVWSTYLDEATVNHYRHSIKTDELQRLVEQGIKIYVGTEQKRYF
ncbi:hypothetical protein C8J57DRAFT_1581856 [Mycena rebaudengoi]|nr:hypothetical protein C8J57DRAFT_1581856 [Mycena rebaudengoi]